MEIKFEDYIFRLLTTSVASELDTKTKTWTTLATAQVKRSKNGIDWEVAPIGVKYSDKSFDTAVERASTILYSLLMEIKEEDFKLEVNTKLSEKVM
jgi:hypothetical protein